MPLEANVGRRRAMEARILLPALSQSKQGLQREAHILLPTLHRSKQGRLPGIDHEFAILFFTFLPFNSKVSHSANFT